MLFKAQNCALLFITITTSQMPAAEEYHWKIREAPSHLEFSFPSPELACRWFYEYSGKYWNYTSPTKREGNNYWDCEMIFGNDPDDTYGGVSIDREGSYCINDRTFNDLSGQCEMQGVSDICPSSIAGNPINFATGYKIQREEDFAFSQMQRSANPIEFSKFYSSVDGLWTHSYSAKLTFEKNSITLINHDRNQSTFEIRGELYEGKTPGAGTLTKVDNQWSYRSNDGRTLEFDDSGKLLSITKEGQLLRIINSDQFITIIDSLGNWLRFTEDQKKQPLTMTTEKAEISYHYNDYKQLTSMKKSFLGHSENKKYFYQDPIDSRLLTAITDERGIQSTTWSYDQYGRAISSERSGLGKISIVYNTDGSSTVTNELGKKTHYQFDLIHGAKRIKSIKGMPSANCPDSNSTFTYGSRGYVESKIDNNGNITTYTHNERGLETSRTVASGTPASKIIITEWHPKLAVPISVTEPNRLIQYTYDTQGRQLSKTITSL